MRTKKIIGPIQMAMLCVLIRLFTLFSYTAISFSVENGCARFLGYLLGFLLSLAMFAPAYYIFKYKGDYSIIDYSKSVSPAVGKVTAVLFFIATLAISAITIAQFDFFITTTIYPNTSKFLYMVILIGAGIYYSSRGLEPIARVANIFFAIFIVGLLFVGVMLRTKINPMNLVTPFYGGIKPILSVAYTVAANNSPLIIFLLLKPNISDKKHKSYFSYITISLIIFEVIAFFIVTVLGEYASNKPFPVYSLISIAQGEILKRYDSLFMFIWILTALIRFSIFFYLSCKCAIEFLPEKIASSRTAITSVLVLIISSIITYNIKLFETAAKCADLGIAVMVTGVVLPIVVILLKKRKDKIKETMGGIDNEK